MSRGFVLLLAFACGVSVANLYYHQPLLAELGSDFHVGSQELGIVSMLCQLGYAAGMLFIVPLGDLLERRSLIVGSLVAVSLALVAQALARDWIWLSFTSFAVGFTTISPQLIIPFAAHIAPERDRGRIVGTLMSGLLLGILLSRTLSGWLGSLFGWRAVYWIACGLMMSLALFLHKALPRGEPTFEGRYSSLMKSLATLVREQPVLRRASWIGAMLFGAFSVFWTTLALHLAALPAHYGSQVAGMFGLVGAVGALAASLAGRWSDRGKSLQVITMGTILLLLSFGAFWLWGEKVAGLILGVILLDFGIQAAHVANLARIYALLPEARSRVNTVYMTSYFLGGALGSALGAEGWNRAGWPGVCAAGFLMSALSLLGLWPIPAARVARISRKEENNLA